METIYSVFITGSAILGTSSGRQKILDLLTGILEKQSGIHFSEKLDCSGQTHNTYALFNTSGGQVNVCVRGNDNKGGPGFDISEAGMSKGWININELPQTIKSALIETVGGTWK